MSFDVRRPIGLLFLLIGVLVAGAGLFGAQSGGLNIDLGWGAVMIVFGAAMLALARRAGGTDG